jgi:hypothetical protein
LARPREFDYKRYLASREWAILREAVRDRANWTCERCLQLPIAATHHLTYERVGHEDLADLQGVCGPCHRFLSAKSDFDPVAAIAALVWPHTQYAEREQILRGLLENLDSGEIVVILSHAFEDLPHEIRLRDRIAVWRDEQAS